ncbi:MAG: putative hydro-lyase [Burkholderiaceae bacterium]|nr:putative hydro-lyase [Burkholderiaceae bacterium]
MEKSELRDLSIEQIRHHIRSGAYSGDTMGVADGHVQANLVILPKEVAFDFLVFCQRNPKPCPLLDVTRPGSPVPELLAPGADLRTDIPRYRVFRRGELVDEPTDIRSYWRDDLVAFLLGCSATFDNALRNARVPLRFLDQDTIPPVYETNVQCRPVGPFHGPVVVTMRPIPGELVVKATQVSGRFPSAHGTPFHIGYPEQIGITDLARPRYGTHLPLRLSEVPMFWACGVTPQAVAMASRTEWMITHAPAHMFLSDRHYEQDAVV